jgi:hypothetical protein
MIATNTSTESQIVALERKYWDAVKHSDATTLEQLTAHEFTYVRSEGVTKFHGHEFARMIAGPGFTLQSYQLDEQHAVFRELTPDVAVFSYPVTMDYVRNGKTGRASSFTSATWVNDGAGWRCAVIAEAPAD